MKKFFTIFLFFSNFTLAQESQNGDALFLVNKNKIDDTHIHWKAVKNIQATCDRESKKRKFGGFGYQVEACSFWDKNKYGENECLIFTQISTSINTIGHEVRHCFQGEWHD